MPPPKCLACDLTPSSTAQSIMSRCIAFALVSIVVLLSACATAPKPAPTEARSDPALAARAAELESAGDYTAAAGLYLGLEGTPAQLAEYRLTAAEILLRGNDGRRAQAVADGLVADGLTPDQMTRLRLVQAESMLLLGDPAGALRYLPDTTQNLSPQRLQQVLTLRVRVFAANDRKTDELLDRLALDRALTDPVARRMNQDQMLDLIRHMPEEELLGLYSLDRDLAGWVALAEIAAIPIDETARFSQAMGEWRARYPYHPASTRAGEIQAGRGTPQIPARAAALLPMSGRLAGAGSQIKAGLDAADLSQTGPRTLVQVYDSAAVSTTALYDQAVREGADIVLGPLVKSNVDILSGWTARTVPVLALNQAESARPNLGGDFFQFGLAPEDDAETVAEGAMERNWARALILYPDSEWGTRIRDAFSATYLALGGTVMDERAYDPDGVDFSIPIGELLHLDQSNQRRKALQGQISRQLEFEARRREDVDLIFLAANAEQVRQIYPQLRFFQLGTLPVVATSHADQGASAGSGNQDLNGMYMVALPWLVAPNQLGIDLPGPEAETMRSSRLFALGVDAYRLMPWLPALRASPGGTVRGATGTLSATPDGRVKRRLQWVQYVEGIPQPLQAAPEQPLE